MDKLIIEHCPFSKEELKRQKEIICYYYEFSDFSFSDMKKYEEREEFIEKITKIGIYDFFLVCIERAVNTKKHSEKGDKKNEFQAFIDLDGILGPPRFRYLIYTKWFEFREKKVKKMLEEYDILSNLSRWF